MCVSLSATGTAWGESLELHLNGVVHPVRAAFPVRTGIPFAPGAIMDERNVKLTINGREAELQTETLARYNDKSIKWLLLDFHTPAGAKLILEFGKGVRRKPVARRIGLTENETGITVDTGRLKAVIRRTGGGFPDELALDMNRDGKYSESERLIAKEGARSNWMDFVHTRTITSLPPLCASASEGKLDRSKVEITELAAEVKGPLHAVVKITGNYRYKVVGTTTGHPYTDPLFHGTMPKGVRRIPFVMRLHFHRDTGMVEVQHTFIYEGDPDRDFAASLALAAPMPSSPDAIVTVGKDEGYTRTPCGKAGTVGLSQTSAEYFRIWKSTENRPPGIMAEGRRAPGWMDVSNSRWGVTAAVWRSWQNYPKAVHADTKTRRLCAYLWPREAGPMSLRRYTRQWGVGETGARDGRDPFALSRHASRGVAKTHRVLFDFHPGRLTEAEIAASTAHFRQKVFAWPAPGYMCRTRDSISTAFSPPEPGKYDRLEKIIDTCLDYMLFCQDRFRWYGMFDYGDIQQCFQNVHSHGRWESDYGRWGWFNGDASGNKPCAALLMQFLRTGRREIFDLFEAEILHITDVDMVNSEEYPWSAEEWRDVRGCCHRHNAQHWACYFVGSRGIQARTFSQLYYLTGDERMRDVMDRCAQGAWEEVVEKKPGRGGHSAGRDAGSRMLYALERTGNRKWRDVIAEKWHWLLNSNRGAAELKAAENEKDDFEWARRPAERALTAKRDYRYPGTVVGRLANGIRYLKDAESRARYREALDKAVAYMEARFKGGVQGQPPEAWPGLPGGPVQGNWNPIPNHMPIAIHALKIHDEAKGGAQ